MNSRTNLQIRKLSPLCIELTMHASYYGLQAKPFLQNESGGGTEVEDGKRGRTRTTHITRVTMETRRTRMTKGVMGTTGTV